MFKKREYVIEPSNEEIKVWKYLDLVKFLSIITTNTLYFRQSSRFEDPFEATIPKKNMEELIAGPNHVVPNDMFMRDQKQFRDELSVNCWHASEFQSDAMWKLYSHNYFGLAIQSKYKLLKQSITDSRDINLGLVEYLDYETDYIEPSQSIKIYMTKRSSFEHEREVRAMVFASSHEDHASLKSNQGLYISVDINTLIEKIYISPYSPDWYVIMIQSFLEKYGFHFPIEKSDLFRVPFGYEV